MPRGRARSVQETPGRRGTADRWWRCSALGSPPSHAMARSAGSELVDSVVVSNSKGLKSSSSCAGEKCVSYTSSPSSSCSNLSLESEERSPRVLNLCRGLFLGGPSCLVLVLASYLFLTHDFAPSITRYLPSYLCKFLFPYRGASLTLII
jgi:hypothetical protein